VLARLGISVRYGGQDLVESLKAKYRDVEEKTETGSSGEHDLIVVGRGSVPVQYKPTFRRNVSIFIVEKIMRGRKSVRRQPTD
jgi:hypothetical protein